MMEIELPTDNSFPIFITRSPQLHIVFCDFNALIIRYPDHVGFLLSNYSTFKVTSSSRATVLICQREFLYKVLQSQCSIRKRLWWYRPRVNLLKRDKRDTLDQGAPSIPDQSVVDIPFPTKMLNGDRFMAPNFTILVIFRFSFGQNTKWWEPLQTHSFTSSDTITIKNSQVTMLSQGAYRCVHNSLASNSS